MSNLFSMLSAYIGDFVNAAAIIAGSMIGLLIKGGVKEKYNQVITQAMGLSVMLIGLSGAIAEVAKPNANVMLFIFCLAIGGVCGEWVNIEGRLTAFAEMLQTKFKSGGIKEGFVTATLIYCIGSMAIIGAIKSGVAGDHSVLFTKSILDGVFSIVLAASLGVGVILSSVSVFIYQGIFVLLSTVIQPYITKEILSSISMTGGVLIMVIGLNMLKMTHIRVGNFLPALLVPFAYYLAIMPLYHIFFG